MRKYLEEIMTVKRLCLVKGGNQMKKNICFVDYDFSVMGGVEKVLKDLAENLSTEYSVHIISICSKGKDIYYDINNKNIEYHAICEGFPRIREAVTKSFSPLRSYIKKNSIDIVFIMGYYPIPILMPIKPFVKTKFIFCDHGSIENQLGDRKAVTFRKLAAKFCDKVVTLTQRNLDAYEKLFKTKSKKLECIYNAIDEEIFDYVADEYDIKSKKIITAGRFTAEKGFDMLVDVANIVLNKHTDWTWDLYGDGEEFESIKNRVNQLGLSDRLILKGRSNEIYKKYKDYSIYVLPSYREGLPLVLLEAKANHLPIVAFDVLTGPREIVSDKENGFLIPCYDKELMAEKICCLIENEELRESFSNRSYDNIDLFKKDSIMRKWVKIIENV